MKKLYRYHLDCGRMGDLDSVFIATDDDVMAVIGKNAHFGDVFGKHSDIVSTNDESEFQALSEDQNLIAALLKIFPRGTISGHNPLTLDYDDR